MTRNAPPPDIRVGYVGLGTMGEPMARNIISAGFPMSVCDLNRAVLARFADAGATVAASPRALADDCTVILVNVVDDAQVEQVVAAPGTGLLDGLRPGGVVVVHSTIHPDICRKLADRIAARGAGLIDAPFTGGPAAAASGTLSLLVGGAAWCVEAARPVLEAEGTILHLGDVGAGELIKLGNNMVLGIAIHAIHEAIQLAASAGVPGDVMLRVLTSGAADCWAARNWSAVGRMARAYPGGAEGLGRLTAKDLKLALTVADDHGLRLRMTQQAAVGLAEPYAAALALLEASIEADAPTTAPTVP